MNESQSTAKRTNTAGRTTKGRAATGTAKNGGAPAAAKSSNGHPCDDPVTRKMIRAGLNFGKHTRYAQMLLDHWNAQHGPVDIAERLDGEPSKLITW